MDYIKVLKRAWRTTWRYPALWVFGIILAITTARNSGGGGGGGAPSGGEEASMPPFNGEFDIPRAWTEIPGQAWAIGAIVVGGLICLGLFLALAFLVARFVATTALIRMVDGYEETGERTSVGGGFRLGWSPVALRLFLINLVVKLPLAVVMVALLLVPIGLLVLSVLAVERLSNFVGILGIVASAGMFMLFILLAIAIGVAISLLLNFFHRRCAIEGEGVWESITNGFAFVKRHLKDAVLMWLIMVGIQIGLAIVMIPVVLTLLVAAAILVGLPSILAGVVAALLVGGPAVWLLVALLGLPMFLLMIILPITFIRGVFEVFTSTTWTVTYREMRALEGVTTAVA